MDTIYIEKSVLEHPRTKHIIEKHKSKKIIPCDRYTEIFNRKKQSFRMQKQNPALIVAKKENSFVHEIPAHYGIGGSSNYYFSHLLNCPFDCQYCFLQGMYKSANYVLFVNYEDFQSEILQKLTDNSYFFTGYDADSLALESTTNFVSEFLPFFERNPNAYFELRTKSVNIRSLTTSKVVPNCIVAYTLSPKIVSEKIELRSPSLDNRLNSISELQKMGWNIGLRFDPIMYVEDFQKTYSEFFEHVFSKISERKLHSVTTGSFRIPVSLFKTMKQNVYNKKILAYLDKNNSNYEYSKKLAQGLISFCNDQLCKYVDKNKVFLCQEF